ncbi:transporter substrate-binding domain-containing protein [Colwellia sp. BRX10-3]|uniref:substrate-binding periplasmic protein n=1 Tax=Colwellia sp. BRX10-3 TaxID=2759844 RepID=UPI0015F5E93A|nr:transporter substrate-binding domain-containing protein [Colwellia sp. BRX10-3]MBA6389859.1 transporter substrate-binding domain-containing protein [Colwellia sp. BRX10-3]
MDKIIICIAAFFMGHCFAAQPLPVLTVASEEWQEYTNADGTGTYWDIVRAVYGEQYQLKFISTTWSRALNLVETGRADVLVGSYKDTNRKLIFPQHHLDIEYPLYAIFDKNIHNISEANDLAGLTIAGKKDYDLQKFLPITSRFYGVEYIDNIVRLIDKKRVDAAICYRTNLYLADPENRFSHQVIGTEERLYLAFTHSSKGEKLQKHYDQEIIKLVADDKLKQYFLNEEEYLHAELYTLLPLPQPLQTLK